MTRSKECVPSKPGTWAGDADIDSLPPNDPVDCRAHRATRDGLYPIEARRPYTKSWLRVNEKRCIELVCEDDHYSGGLSRGHSIAIASELILCLCGHSVAAHLNPETKCNGAHSGKGCYCQNFVLDTTPDGE